MQYNLTINQYAANSLGLIGELDAIDLLLFDFIYHMMNNPKVRKSYIDGYEYVNIRHANVSEECPILGINHRDAFRKRMLKLVNTHLLERYENNSAENTSLYRRGSLFSALAVTSYDCSILPADENRHPADENRHKHNTTLFKDKSLNDIYKRKYIKESGENLEKSVDDIEETFEIFWELYDKKVGKEQCRKIWYRLPKKARKEILDRTPAYIAATPDKQYRKNPQTYLNPNNKHWLDEIIPQEHENNRNTDADGNSVKHIGNNKRDEAVVGSERKRDYSMFEF